MPPAAAISVSDWHEKATAKALARAEKKVRPWVEKFPFQARFPVRFNGSEGYAGKGVLGSRAGPADNIDFENLCHEMGHAIEIAQTAGAHRLRQAEWGLRIRSTVVVAGEHYREPRTLQATEREARAVAIQIRLMQLVDHPDVPKMLNYYAKVLTDHMEDWWHGGVEAKDRLAQRRGLIEKALADWPASRVVAGWERVQPVLEALANPPAPKRRRGPGV